jgi:Cys-tRNA synthase (O-phospho-L-seryl-tRNA:Cys-tRNA synthase)
MKKIVLIVFLCIALAFLVGCETEPLFTTYGETVHNAVKEYYDNYEILDLIRLEKDEKPTLHNFCIVNDMQGGIDVLCISYSLDNDNTYSSSQSIIINDAIQDEIYSSNEAIENTMVKFVICEKQNIPDYTLQKEKFTFENQSLYFCIIEVSAT